MVALTKQIYQRSHGKKRQWVSAEIDGELIEYQPDKHIKMNIRLSGDQFTLKPVFVDSTMTRRSSSHAAVKPRVVLINGPAEQVAPNTFKVDTTYFGKDLKRLWTGITLCIEAEGNNTYKSAVQEVNVQLDRPRPVEPVIPAFGNCF